MRGSAVVAELHAEGVTEERLAALETPAGLDIGARTPEEIALSILARIVAVRRGEQTLSVRVVVAAPPRTRADATAIDPVCGMAVVAPSSRRRTSTTRAGASTSAATAVAPRSSTTRPGTSPHIDTVRWFWTRSQPSQ